MTKMLIHVLNNKYALSGDATVNKHKHKYDNRLLRIACHSDRLAWLCAYAELYSNIAK